MPAQKYGSGKNFIGLHQETREQRVITEMRTSIERRIRQHVFHLMAAMFDRRSKAK
jgi:hypothetical protein